MVFMWNNMLPPSGEGFEGEDTNEPDGMVPK